jgi:hypothetical protein
MPADNPPIGAQRSRSRWLTTLIALWLVAQPLMACCAGLQAGIAAADSQTSQTSPGLIQQTPAGQLATTPEGKRPCHGAQAAPAEQPAQVSDPASSLAQEPPCHSAATLCPGCNGCPDTFIQTVKTPAVHAICVQNAWDFELSLTGDIPVSSLNPAPHIVRAPPGAPRRAETPVNLKQQLLI